MRQEMLIRTVITCCLGVVFPVGPRAKGQGPMPEAGAYLIRTMRVLHAIYTVISNTTPTLLKIT